jgi:Putative peptidoglycan binding domain
MSRIGGSSGNSPKTTNGVTKNGSITRGATGAKVTAVQRQLNAAGYKVKMDGKFGANTQAAVAAFQAKAKLNADGFVGAKTMSALNGVKPGSAKPAVGGAGPVTLAKPGQKGAEGVAQINGYWNKGQRNQGATGTLKVNGKTYTFASGGGGMGNLPMGKYKVEKWQTNKPTQQVGGKYFSYRLLKQNSAGKWVDAGIKDPRFPGVGRSVFRIHPDGGGKGTIGCIGINGMPGVKNSRAVQESFDRDMKEQLAKGPYYVTVQ